MPEVKVSYRFKGDRFPFHETEILQLGVNTSFYFHNRNSEYNDNLPAHEPQREIVAIEIIDPWKHLHSFYNVPGFDYFMCNNCGCIAIRKASGWERLQPFEGDQYEYCKEKIKKLPEIQEVHIKVNYDLKVEEIKAEDRKELKALPRTIT